MQLPLFDLPGSWSATAVSELPAWSKVARLGLDTETCDPNLKTTGPSVRTGGFLAGVSFAIEDGPAHYLPVRHLLGGNLPEDEVFRYLKDQAKQFQGILVGANLNYDLDYLAERGVVFSNLKCQRDVQVAEPLIDELQMSYSLENIAARHGLPGKEETHLRQAALHYGVDPKADLWKLPAKHVGEYATVDAELPLKLLRRQEKIIDAQNLWKVFDLECRLQPVLLKMRRWGIKIDLDQLDKVECWALEQEVMQINEIKRITGRQLQIGGINKKPPLVAILQAVGVELTEKTATGGIKLTSEILENINHPIAGCINRARKVNKLRTTFVASVKTHMVGDRIHCTFNQLRNTREQGDEKGARYGRMSCTDPNLQQQPARDDFAKMWRSIYIPDNKSQLFMSADYSQQEPRMTTHFAELMELPRATEMAKQFRTNPDTDNHAMATRWIHPEAADMDDKDPAFLKLRKSTKGVFLGLCYGMGGALLAHKLDLPTKWITNRNGRQVEVAGEAAQALSDMFNKKVPYVGELAKLCSAKAASRGYIMTLLGRRCRFPRKSNGQYDWTHKALNRLIQGSGGDQTKLAMVELDAAGLVPQLQVHDEICRPIGDLKQAQEIKEIMEHCIELMVPSKVDIEVGPSWGEAK